MFSGAISLFEWFGELWLFFVHLFRPALTPPFEIKESACSLPIPAR